MAVSGFASSSWAVRNASMQLFGKRIQSNLLRWTIRNTRNSGHLIKLKEDFGLDDITVSKAFLNLKSVSSETFVRSFQFKLLDDIIFTNTRLAKIGYIAHDTCTFCEVESETVYHLFYQCPLTYLFFGKTLKISGSLFQANVRNSRYKTCSLEN